ncbi:hypothetical protein [Longimicrobium sp.]|jgi:hypothetical protein|uniref:hypothetical protein n=1 Tax=Longimicrobium sp. TaxID=2029185 RepID=UPI002F9441F1
MRFAAFAGTVLTLSLAACSVQAALRFSPETADKSIVSAYDEFKNEHTMTANGAIAMPGTALSPGELVMTTTSFTTPGREPRRPRDVVFVMQTGSYDGWQYLQNSELIFISNKGPRVNLGQAVHDGDVHAGGGMVKVDEALGYSIPLADLRTLAAADTLRARVGNDEFVLPGDQAQVMVWRALLRRIDALTQ